MANKKHLSDIVASLTIILGLTVTACRASVQQPTVPDGAKPGDLTLEPCVFEMKTGRYEPTAADWWCRRIETRLIHA